MTGTGTSPDLSDRGHRPALGERSAGAVVDHHLAASPDPARPSARYEFVQTTRAWYFDTIRETSAWDRHTVEEISVICRSADGHGARYEFLVAWVALAGERRPAAQVRIFDDAFAAFIDLAPLFQALARTEGGVSVDAFIDLLLAGGAVDGTPTVDPARPGTPAVTG